MKKTIVFIFLSGLLFSTNSLNYAHRGYIDPAEIKNYYGTCNIEENIINANLPPLAPVLPTEKNAISIKSLIQNNTIQSIKQAKNTLILYDRPDPELWNRWVGTTFAIFLRNYLGHFDVNISIKYVDRYIKDDLFKYDVTFYIGTMHNAPLPSIFKDDVMKLDSSKPNQLCWIGHNIHQLAREPGTFNANMDFVDHFGFSHWGITDAEWTNVRYKNTLLRRALTSWKVDIVFPYHQDRVQTLATFYRDPDMPAWMDDGFNPSLSHEWPYIIKSVNNLWFISDFVFHYASEGDRFLAFADLLHDILGSNAEENHRAFIRIEDIHPHSSYRVMREFADMMHQKGIPFGINLHPEFVSVDHSQSIDDSPEFIEVLNYMIEKGGQIIMHGFTHQYSPQDGNEPSTPMQNPFNGRSGDDNEFVRYVFDENGNPMISPIPEDIQTQGGWSRKRMQDARDALNRYGFEPVGWSTPHYFDSIYSIQAYNKYFSWMMHWGGNFDPWKTSNQHLPLYINNDSIKTYEDQIPLIVQRGCYIIDDFYFSQITPYVIHCDYYGRKIFPETIGYMDGKTVLASDILEYVDACSVVRDGWASFFVHDNIFNNHRDEVETIIDGIIERGFTFTKITSNIE